MIHNTPPFVFDRQMLLADLIDDLPWAYDLQTGILSFGDRYHWKAEVLGTESEETGTWLWAWANEASNIPAQHQTASLNLKNFGEAHDIDELTEPMVPLDHADGHAFASIAVGEGLGKAYYRGPYNDGAVFLLITDENLQLQVEVPLLHILTVFPQAISALDLPDHREALRGYLKHYGFEPKDEGDALLLCEEGEELFRATFDEWGRLQEMKGILDKQNPARNGHFRSAAQTHPSSESHAVQQDSQSQSSFPDTHKLSSDQPMQDSHAQSQTEGSAPSSAWEFLASLLPLQNLTQEALNHQITPAVSLLPDSDDPANDLTFEPLARGLHRRSAPHLLITGERGVGKTTVIRELARKAANGDYPFLNQHQFLWLDCQNVGPEDSRACLETILQVAGETGERIVLCLEGFDALLRRPQGGNNKPLVRAAAERSGLHIIGILSKWDYEDLISGDAAMLDLFTKIEVEEPSEEVVQAITQHHADRLSQQYDVTIGEDVVKRVVMLTSNYLLNECHPAKAIRVLETICEEIRFDRNQLKQPRLAIEPGDIIRVIAARTGIPEETLSGESKNADYEAALGASVVGQEVAIGAIANELRLIKAGLTEPGKPASVLLFAGMTGVGKTELAKRIAELYSTSGRLQTYTMGNFTEPHTVSGIIGVPPGYVGHEQGGRLINELNADPYSVFLLDEAEKAHPNVWKPFLNLFDEGWIVDQRGIKAHADRAIFLLTTNAGDKQIAQMSQSNKSEEEIVDRVKQTLSRIRHERSTQPVFAPQFLARLQRILVFRPLDEAAMIGIARLQVKHMQSNWKRKREKTLIIPETLIQRIGQLGHELNEAANGQEGGRIIRKLLVDVIESPIQQMVTNQLVEYQQATEILISWEPSSAMENPGTRFGGVSVSFC